MVKNIEKWAFFAQKCQSPTVPSSLRSPRKKQLCQLLYGSHFATIIGQPIGHGLGILAKDTFALHTADFASALVIAGLNSRESFRAVHYVRLEINHRATKSSGGQQIARLHITARPALRH